MQSDVVNLSKENIAEVANLYLECFNAPDKGENWDLDTAIDYLFERAQEGSSFLTLKDSNQNLIGLSIGGNYKKSFISGELSTNISNGYYISVIAVSNRYQGHGYGKILMSESLGHIKSIGFKNSIIRCREENYPMRHIIEKNGFQQLECYISELGGVNCKRVVYIKSLLQEYNAVSNQVWH